MKFFMNFPEPFAGDVGVNLGCGDAFMAQEFLKGSYVHPLAEQVGAEAVPHHVGSGS